MLALLFPGQGAQRVGMGRDVFERSQAARETFEAADTALGFSLSKIIFEGPESELRRTELQQPAILTTSIALLRALEEIVPVLPDFVLGHSLGEYSALVAVEAIGFEDAVRVVHARGAFMQEAVPEGRGAMAAILGLTADEVVACCAEVSGDGMVVAPANYNSPAQTVIAGHVEAVERASALALDRGAKRAVPLDVSAPFHCSLMRAAAEKLVPELGQIRFRDPRVPVISNVEACENRSAARIPSLLEAQVTAPVRFCESVETLVSQGVTQFLEIGPGSVLTGLVARIQRRAQRVNLSDFDGLEGAAAFAAGA
jgi:[acyl-carrier-protein] S-malonyltransferase